MARRSPVLFVWYKFITKYIQLYEYPGPKPRHYCPWAVVIKLIIHRWHRHIKQSLFWTVLYSSGHRAFPNTIHNNMAWPTRPEEEQEIWIIYKHHIKKTRTVAVSRRPSPYVCRLYLRLRNHFWSIATCASFVVNCNTFSKPIFTFKIGPIVCPGAPFIWGWGLCAYWPLRG
jgi:hypothetical protein